MPTGVNPQEPLASSAPKVLNLKSQTLVNMTRTQTSKAEKFSPLQLHFKALGAPTRLELERFRRFLGRRVCPLNFEP